MVTIPVKNWVKPIRRPSAKVSTSVIILLTILPCGFASMYLIASIANADRMVKSGIDKDLEWFGAYAITLNVIYLFLEVLRLILILVSRNRD